MKGKYITFTKSRKNWTSDIEESVGFVLDKVKQTNSTYYLVRVGSEIRLVDPNYIIAVKDTYEL